MEVTVRQLVGRLPVVDASPAYLMMRVVAEPAAVWPTRRGSCNEAQMMSKLVGPVCRKAQLLAPDVLASLPLSLRLPPTPRQV
jgi:hypothetical protein